MSWVKVMGERLRQRLADRSSSGVIPTGPPMAKTRMSSRTVCSKNLAKAIESMVLPRSVRTIR
jgi:hypothetical protein